jgi:hypothetical protein
VPPPSSCHSCAPPQLARASALRIHTTPHGLPAAWRACHMMHVWGHKPPHTPLLSPPCVTGARMMYWYTRLHRQGAPSPPDTRLHQGRPKDAVPDGPHQPAHHLQHPQPTAPACPWRIWWSQPAVTNLQRRRPAPHQRYTPGVKRHLLSRWASLPCNTTPDTSVTGTGTAQAPVIPPCSPPSNLCAGPWHCQGLEQQARR